MTEATWREIEGDVRLPLRRISDRASWPVWASALLHIVAVAGLYPSGEGASPGAPDLSSIDVVMVMPGEKATQIQGRDAARSVAANAAQAARPAEAIRRDGAATVIAAPAPETVVVANAVDAVFMRARVPEAAARPASEAASAAAPVKAATAVAATATAPSPATANLPPTPTNDAMLVEANAASSGAVAFAAPRSPATTSAFAPAEIVAGSHTPRLANASPPGLAATATTGAPPATDARPPADIVSQESAARLSSLEPPPPLPHRRPPSLLAAARNPRIGAPMRQTESALPPMTPTLGEVGGPLPRRVTSPASEAGGRPATEGAPSSVASRSGEVAADYRSVAFFNPPPVYPLSARRRGVEGQVLLRVRLSAEGRAISVAIQRSSGFADLDKAALIAVERWRFRPAEADGRAVEGVVDVPISFQLQR